jgi:serine-type D-Ala-D-Ala carboxypeptidase (penicillin-binding protein 5/6)
MEKSALRFCKPFAWVAALTLALAPAASDAAKKKSPAAKKKSAPAKTVRSKAAPPRPSRPPATPAPVIPVLPPFPGELPLLADGAIVIDAYSGKPLYEKEADTPQYPASTTKIMTALLVIEEGDLDREIEVIEEESKVGESGLSIKPGDRFTRRQGLFGLMLKSANDVAHALARDNAGSVEAFAEKMTRRARELGATNTSFTNPHGLHHPAHYTTPRDLARITRAAMQQPLFRQIVASRQAPWEIASTGPRALRNHNKLLWDFPGCTGVKTGFTNPAQHALASAAIWECREMISVVMHSTRAGKWEDSKLLLTYAFANPPETAHADAR